VRKTRGFGKEASRNRKGVSQLPAFRKKRLKIIYGKAGRRGRRKKFAVRKGRNLGREALMKT